MHRASVRIGSESTQCSGESMSVGEMVRFDRADSGRLTNHAEPLRLLQKKGISVYIKIDRSRHFARVHDIGTIVVINNFSWLWDGLESAPPRWLGVDNDMLYLKLDDEHLSEMRESGDCHISIFKSGGLKRSRSPDSANGTVRDKGVDSGPLVISEFFECSLIDRKCWEKKLRGLEIPPQQELMKRDYCVAKLKVCLEDLYLATSDVQALKSEGSLDWDRYEYPLKGGDGYDVPMTIDWLYQSSHALNQMPKSKPSDVARWLEKFAPKEAYAMRSIKTIAALAHPKYKNRKRFDGVDLEDFAPAHTLPAELLTKPVRLLMAITDWWLNTRATWERDWENRPEETRGYLWEPLASELKNARFDRTATRELTAVISNLSVTDAAWKKCLPKLGVWNKYRASDGP